MSNICFNTGILKNNLTSNNNIMKHLIKNIGVAIFSILFIILSIKSSYAGENYSLIKIVATSNQTLDLELDKNNNDTSFLKSDLGIYKSLENIPTKNIEDSSKVQIELTSLIERNTSYSLMSIF
jgi:hypothetical protein